MWVVDGRTQILLSKSAHLQMQSAMKETWICETGGPLVGFYKSSSQVVVIAATGPGPKSKQSIWGIEIDGEYSQQFCDSLFYSSDGQWDYVGDWHCHPSFSISPSPQDEEAIELMASVKGITSHPISIIASRFTGKLHGYIWNGERLVAVPLIIGSYTVDD